MVADQQPYHLIISKYDGSIIQKITIPSKEQKTLVIFGDNDQKVIPTFFAIFTAIFTFMLSPE